MNYYENIKDILVKNEIYKQVKDYSKNKNDLESYYEVGKLKVVKQEQNTETNLLKNIL